MSRRLAPARRPTAAENDAGAVTVEAALGIGVVITVFGLALLGVGAVVSQLRCTDAAVEAARLVARGAHEEAAEAVERLAPQDAELTITIREDRVITEVGAPAPVGFLPEPASKAYAVLEPGVSTADGNVPGKTPGGPGASSPVAEPVS